MSFDDIMNTTKVNNDNKMDSGAEFLESKLILLPPDQEEDLEQLQLDVSEMNQMFAELGVYVLDQGKSIQTMDECIHKSEEHTSVANSELTQANIYNNRYRYLLGTTLAVGGTVAGGIGILGFGIMGALKLGLGVGVGGGLIYYKMK